MTFRRISMLPTTRRRHARIAIDAVIASQGKMHWLCTYATDDRKLFGLVVAENEGVIDEFVRNAGIGGTLKIHRVLRTLDPSLAAYRRLNRNRPIRAPARDVRYPVAIRSEADMARTAQFGRK
jgi:hypothetical protein